MFHSLYGTLDYLLSIDSSDADERLLIDLHVHHTEICNTYMIGIFEYDVTVGFTERNYNFALRSSGLHSFDFRWNLGTLNYSF